jgi:alpha/beta hydrolase family protein
MATFSLVHGAWLGGWCWAEVRAELESHGHVVHAPDLPCEDAALGFDDYAALVPTADVVVGHSLGGHTIPRVTAQVHVFVCALVPGVDERGAEFPEFTEQIVFVDEHRHVLHDAARALDFPPGREDLAARLRPQRQVPRVLVPLPEHPVYVVCSADTAVRPAWQRQAARRLGVEPVELVAGHMPMLTHARELAAILHAAS